MAATYSHGSSGNTVKKIQNWLNQYGYNTGGDTLGSYGAGTQDAVNRLQADYGLTANGTFDQSALDILYGIRDGTAQKVQQHTPTTPDTGTATVPTVQAPVQTPTQTPEGEIVVPDTPGFTIEQLNPGMTTTSPEQIFAEMMGNGGVSSGTQAMLDTFTSGYKASDNVNKAIAQYQAALAAKPGAYESKYDAIIKDLYDQISNRKPFNYDVNGDALYEIYKDQYTLAGQQAMMDTMGQAAALTGGYGNSYASTAGNQAYQQFMTQLANKVPELAEIAYGRYMDEGEKLYNLYNMNVAADERDYGRYADSYNWWMSDLDRAQDLMLYADSTDYDRWNNDRNYWTDRADTEYDRSWQQYMNAQDQYWANKEFDFNADWTQKEFDNQNYWANKEFENDNYWANKEFDYNSSWADKEFNAEQSAADREYAYDTAMGMLGSGVMPSTETLNAAGISVSDAQSIIRQLQAQTTSKGSSGSGKDLKSPTMSMYEKALEKFNEGGDDGMAAYLAMVEMDGYDAAALYDYAHDYGKYGLINATIDLEKLKESVKNSTGR